jgi:hypothetical protein
MARMEYFILNDVDLSFKDILKRSLSGEPLLDKKELEEWEQQRAARRNDAAGGDVEKATKAAAKKKKAKKGGGRRTEEDNDSHHEEENGEAMEVGGGEEEDEELSCRSLTDKPSAAEKAKAVERAAILAPQLNLQQIEAAIAKGGGGGYDQDMINDLMAQTYAASVRWPKDRVLHVRLKHIVTAVEEGRWPVAAHSLLLLEQAEDSGAATPEPAGANGNHGAARDTSTPLSEVRICRCLCLIYFILFSFDICIRA